DVRHTQCIRIAVPLLAHAARQGHDAGAHADRDADLTIFGHCSWFVSRSPRDKGTPRAPGWESEPIVSPRFHCAEEGEFARPSFKKSVRVLDFDLLNDLVGVHSCFSFVFHNQNWISSPIERPAARSSSMSA